MTDIHDALRRIEAIETLGWDVHIYPDAEELIQSRLVQERLRAQAEERDEQGRPQLRISLPDESTLRQLAESLARLLK